jgi:hypothetical protein
MVFNLENKIEILSIMKSMMPLSNVFIYIRSETCQIMLRFFYLYYFQTFLDVRGSSGSRNFGSKRGSQEEARNQKADSHFGRERFKLTKEEIRRM